MIRKCGSADEDRVFLIINEAARAFKGVIPEDCYHEPYMSREELSGEMDEMVFFGYEEGGELIGVMGFQPLGDVTLIRHAYVLPQHQRRGVGSRLLQHLMGLAKTSSLLVGTWEDVDWAIRLYEKHGFRLLPNKKELLRRYWRIPDRQIETSVVLGIDIKNQSV